VEQTYSKEEEIMKINELMTGLFEGTRSEFSANIALSGAKLKKIPKPLDDLTKGLSLEPEPKKKPAHGGDPRNHTGHKVKEAATAGATSSANIGTVPNPHLSPGSARGKKSYTGTPGQSGTKAPPQPSPKKQKPSDNALNMKGTSIFGQAVKR
jgi:hypothetical protein